MTPRSNELLAAAVRLPDDAAALPRSRLSADDQGQLVFRAARRYGMRLGGEQQPDAEAASGGAYQASMIASSFERLSKIHAAMAAQSGSQSGEMGERLGPEHRAAGVVGLVERHVPEGGLHHARR